MNDPGPAQQLLHTNEMDDGSKGGSIGSEGGGGEGSSIGPAPRLAPIDDNPDKFEDFFDFFGGRPAANPGISG